MNSIDLHEVFYESEPGILRWKTDRMAGRWMKVKLASAGDIAGCKLKGDGRWQITYAGHSWLRSRWIWIMHNGPIQAGMEIDHKDGDCTRDSIDNLRLANRSQNKANIGKKKNNTSGYKGVSKFRGGWRARIMVNGKEKHLGAYPTPEAAYNHYCKAAKELYGEFSNFG